MSAAERVAATRAIAALVEEREGIAAFLTAVAALREVPNQQGLAAKVMNLLEEQGIDQFRTVYRERIDGILINT